MKQLKILKPVFGMNEELEVISLNKDEVFTLVKEDEKKYYLQDSNKKEFTLNKKSTQNRVAIKEITKEEQLELPVDKEIPNKEDFKKEMLGVNDFPDKQEMIVSINKKKSEIKKIVIDEILVETKKEVMNSIKEMNGEVKVFLKDIYEKIELKGIFHEALANVSKILETKGYEVEYDEERGILTLC